MGKTSIEWAHYTFNPWRGCTKVSDGCKFCYADRDSKRNPKVLGIWGPNGTRAIGADAYMRLPFKWNDEAKAAGERRRVFCASLADFFEGPESMPAEADGPVTMQRWRTFDIIPETPWLDWLLVTKRPENIRRMWPLSYLLKGLPNVWLLTSVEDQETADRRIPELLKCRDLSPVLGLSMEPLLGAIHLDHHGVPAWWQGQLNPISQLDWIIAGGESGAKSRPMHPDWARSVRDQCQAAGVPFFFKQWGEWKPADECEGERRVLIFQGEAGARPISGPKNPEWHDWPNGWASARVGKKAAGRRLDGRTWDELPLVKS